jgi:thiamine biosynthesis lipoprotein
MNRTMYQTIARWARIMGCAASLHAAVPEGDAPAAEAAVGAVLAWLGEVEACLTRFDPTSELSRLNRSAGTWFAASETLYAVTALALAAAQATDGLFDPTLLAQMERIGYDRDYAQIARRDIGAATAAAPPAAGGWRDIALDPAARRIRLPEGVGVDLGGIAKGWAADEAMTRFFASIPNAIVSLGGDLRLRGGPQPGELWAVGVYDPTRPPADIPAGTGEGAGHPPLCATLTLGEGGVASSSATGQWWRQGAARRHHIIDPRTGEPARVWVAPGDDRAGEPLVALATALAPTAAAAEVAAKVALLGGDPSLVGQSFPVGQTFLSAVEVEARAVATAPQGVPPRSPPKRTGAAGVTTIVVMGDGRLVCSENLEAYLALHGGGNVWRMS